MEGAMQTPRILVIGFTPEGTYEAAARWITEV